MRIRSIFISERLLSDYNMTKIDPDGYKAAGIILLLVACGGGAATVPATYHTSPPQETVYEGNQGITTSLETTPIPHPQLQERTYGTAEYKTSTPQPTPKPSTLAQQIAYTEAQSTGSTVLLVCSYEWDCETALSIMWRESRGDPLAYSTIPVWDSRSYIHYARCLFQLLSPMHDDYFMGDWRDPEVCIAAAYRLYQDEGWEPWN